MDLIYLVILGVGVGLILGGARMMYCGHRHRHEYSARRDRRSTDKRPA